MISLPTLKRILAALWVIYMAALGGTQAGLQSPTLKAISLVLLVAGMLYAAISLARSPQKPPRALWPLAAWVIVQAISLMASGELERGAFQVFWWACVVIAFWASTVVDDAALEHAIFAVIASVTLIALYEVLAWWAFSGFPLAEPPRPASVLNNPNNVAAAALVGLALAFRQRRWVWLGVFVLAMALTAARAAMVGALAGAVVFALLAGKPIKVSRTVLIGLLVAALIVIPLAVFGFFYNTTHGTLAQRLEIWSIALRVFAAHPLTGAGPGGYQPFFIQIARLQHDRIQPHAHSVYLQTAAETGLLGLAVLAWLVIVCGLAVVNAYRRSQDGQGEAKRVAALGAAFMVGLMVQGTVEYVYWLAASVLIALWAGRVMLSPLEPKEGVEPTADARRRRMWSAAIIVVGLVVFPLAAYADAGSAVYMGWTTVLGFVLACLIFMVDFRIQIWGLEKGR